MECHHIWNESFAAGSKQSEQAERSLIVQDNFRALASCLCSGACACVCVSVVTTSHKSVSVSDLSLLCSAVCGEHGQEHVDVNIRNMYKSK